MAAVRASELLISRRRGLALLATLILLLGLAPGVTAGDEHPNDGKVVFFKYPDDAALKEIRKAIEDDFGATGASERAKGRAVCYRYPLWSVPWLRKLLTGELSGQSIQRINAILTLARLLDPRAAQALRGVAEKDSSPQAKAFACLSLGLQPGPKSLEVCLRRLRVDGNPDVRVAALFALARLGGSEAEEAIRATLRNGKTDRDVMAALVSLSFFPSADAVAAIRTRLDDSKTEMRLRALLALCNTAFEPVAERRDELVKIAGDRSEDERLRALAVLAIARFDWRGGTAQLVKALGDAEPEVREAAARGLQHRADPRARDAIRRHLGGTMDGDARLAARLLIALADIEAVAPSEEGRKLLVKRLGSPSNAIQIYAALALTRIDDWTGFEKIRERAISGLTNLRKRGGLSDAERSNFLRATSLLDPENAPDEVPDGWVSPWGDEDKVLASIDRTLHEEFLDRTNWFVSEEMRVNSVKETPISRADLATGTHRVMAHGSPALRDLKTWLAEVPYFTEDQLPDRGYGE